VGSVGSEVSILLFKAKMVMFTGKELGNAVILLSSQKSCVSVEGNAVMDAILLCSHSNILSCVNPSTPAKLLIFLLLTFKVVIVLADGVKLSFASMHVEQAARIAAAKLASGIFCPNVLLKRNKNRNAVNLRYGLFMLAMFTLSGWHLFVKKD
jgi:hypothetical protein